ncbi:MAG: FAD-binding oxidoreductase [Bacteroidetes bacterium]|nr:FAD-binding oxidoreductase [Bacteroidota bacterium]
MIDFLIVGGGIAGINFAWQAEQHQYSYHLIDPFLFNSSTAVAAGLINPVTGRKFATQWNMETLIPLAEKHILNWKILPLQFFYRHPIIKIHKNESIVEEWIKIQSSTSISPYINVSPNLSKYARYLDFRYGAIGVSPGFRLNTAELITAFKNRVADKIITGNFDYNVLKINAGNFEYNNNSYKNIIFCEGVATQQNPWFNFIAFKPAKGECLIIEIPNYETNEIIIKGIILIPLGNNKFWVGATNTWNDLSNTPTEAGRAELENGLQQLLKLPYTLLAHKAAVRPSIRDRTPVVGQQPEIANMYVLNGLGTKGTSLAPYYAKQLFEHIINGSAINKEVAVNRF